MDSNPSTSDLHPCSWLTQDSRSENNGQEGLHEVRPCPKASQCSTHRMTLPNHQIDIVQSPDIMYASLTHNHCTSIVLLSGDSFDKTSRLAPHVPDLIDNH
jgi:hypothetical protein